MNSAYSPTRTHNVSFDVTVTDLIATLEKTHEHGTLSEVTKALQLALHDIVCSKRLKREELLQIKTFADNYALEFISQDATSRIRNLTAN
jgi:hypothetical protein